MVELTYPTENQERTIKVVSRFLPSYTLKLATPIYYRVRAHHTVKEA